MHADGAGRQVTSPLKISGARYLHGCRVKMLVRTGDVRVVLHGVAILIIPFPDLDCSSEVPNLEYLPIPGCP
jgi:hypothetical protein